MESQTWLLFLPLLVCTVARCDQLEPLHNFILDLIKTWNLLLPTIVMEEYLSDLCIKQNMGLCLINNGEQMQEMAKHLNAIYQGRKQDGIIFLGTQYHEHLIDQMIKLAPAIFTSEYPVFMPIEYSDMMTLRLDSNIIFYKSSVPHRYELFDKFAVKGGPPIKLKLGLWELEIGVTLQSSMNRWERRTDLGGALLINGVKGRKLIEVNGTIIGSEGYFQDKLFYMTDRLNLTMKTVQSPNEAGYILANGSWTGCIGMLQKGQIDVESSGRGIQNNPVVDYPSPAYRVPRVMITNRPEGAAPNMWVYLRVFGLTQWSIYLASLVLIAIGLFSINIVNRETTSISFGSKRGYRDQYELNAPPSYVALVYLYTIQMGSHTTADKTAARIVSLTLSVLAFVMFAFYTTNITAEMTSGPPTIPVRNFDDIIRHDYKVILSSSYLKKILASEEPGTAKHTVYKTYVEPRGKLMTMGEAFKELSMDPKTLYYSCKCAMANKRARPYQKQLVAISLDDDGDAFSSFLLLRESEFLPLFNYYMLKLHEHGIEKWIYKRHHMVFFTNEQFGMTEVLPLGYDNVMFTFMCLGIGICISLLSAAFERMVKRKPEKNRSNAWTTTKQ